VDAGRYTPLCEVIIGVVGGVSRSTIGVSMRGSRALQLAGNEVHVAPHQTTAVGLSFDRSPLAQGC
jgi:hypothetical protein